MSTRLSAICCFVNGLNKVQGKRRPKNRKKSNQYEDLFHVVKTLRIGCTRPCLGNAASRAFLLAPTGLRPSIVVKETLYYHSYFHSKHVDFAWKKDSKICERCLNLVLVEKIACICDEKISFISRICLARFHFADLVAGWHICLARCERDDRSARFHIGMDGFHTRHGLRVGPDRMYRLLGLVSVLSGYMASSQEARTCRRQGEIKSMG